MEEGDQFITDAFFSGGLIIGWSPEKHVLMLRFIAKRGEDGTRMRHRRVMEVADYTPPL